MRWPLLLACGVLGFVSFAAARAGATIEVPAGGDLQQAIDRARPGDTILLEPGATYVGNFVLPYKPGDAFITIRTGGTGDGLPGDGVRVTPAHAGKLAKLKSPDRQPVLQTRPRAHHWRLQWLEFHPTQDGHGDIIRLGDGSAQQATLRDVPHHLVVDRCYIHGDPAVGQKRGVALNSAATEILNSHISDIKAVGQDAQAIAGWNGPGPYRIENNYLEAAGENFILGGSDSPIEGLVTADVVFRRNHLAKPEAWRAERWQVKNLFQLKSARRVLVEENLLENVWKDAQVGFAVLLTPRNQDGKAPWAIVEDVTLRRNIIRHAGAGIQITGEDDNHPSGRTSKIRIADNLLYDISGPRWAGNGAFLMIGYGPQDVVVERNTVVQTGNVISAYGGRKDAPAPVTGFVFRGNVVLHNQYGVHGASRGVGNPALETFFPGAVFTANIIAGGEGRRYPAGNTFISREDFDALFVDAAAGDFRLRRPVPDAGANVEAILAALPAAR